MKQALLTFLAHDGESHEVEKTPSLISKILHWPTWASVLLVVVILAVTYLLTDKALKLTFAGRLFVMVAATIVMGILYVPHNATVTGIILSAGFIVTFLLTFTLLGRRGT